MLLKACFAFLKLVTGRCQDFDMLEFKSNIAYFYAPSGPVFYIFYLAAGLAVPIVMQKLVDLAVKYIRKAIKPTAVRT